MNEAAVPLWSFQISIAAKNTYYERFYKSSLGEETRVKVNLFAFPLIVLLYNNSS